MSIKTISNDKSKSKKDLSNFTMSQVGRRVGLSSIAFNEELGIFVE